MPRVQIWAIRRRQVPTRTPPATSAHCSGLTPAPPPARRALLAPRRTPRPLVAKPDMSLRTRPARPPPPQAGQAQLQDRRATPPLAPCRVRVLRQLLTRLCRVRVLRQLLTRLCRVWVLRLAPTPGLLPLRPQGPRPLHPLLPARTSRLLRRPVRGRTLIRTRQARVSAQCRQRTAATPACRRRRMGCPAGSPRVQLPRTSRRTTSRPITPRPSITDHHRPALHEPARAGEVPHSPHPRRRTRCPS